MEQLVMVHADPGSVDPPRAPDGLTLRAYREGDEQAWADVVNATDLRDDYDASKVRRFLTARPRFDPEGLFRPESPQQHCPGQAGGLAGGLFQRQQDAHGSSPAGVGRRALGWAWS